MIALLVVAGCARGGLHSPALPRAPQRWEVDVLSAVGPRTLEAHYALCTERTGRDRWRFRTLRTRGEWLDHSGRATYDSDAPQPADPWPLTLQHAVSAVPADVVVEEGRPVSLVDADAWRSAAHAAIYAAPVPAEALVVGDQLVDPEGLVDDLARTFPGVPAEAGAWERRERLGGVEAVVREDCAPADDGWACTGAAEAAPGAEAKLFEVATSAAVAVDRQGLASLTSRYTGTLVTLAPGGHGVADQPISGIRSVRRTGSCEAAP
ncbi:MAG: hypothetical protein R3F59_16805 [Myxococcota bacterium]